jgi:hypothetical protein
LRFFGVTSSEEGTARTTRDFFFLAIFFSSPDGARLRLLGPRSEELREAEATWLRGGLGRRDWLRLWLLLLLRLLDGALRSGGRGRGLFFGLLLFVLSNELCLLVAERIGDLPARIAEVELQDGLSDVLMSPRQKIAPLEIPGRIAAREQVDRVPVAAVLLDESCVTQRLVDGRERARRLRIDHLQKHERAKRTFDAVGIVRKQPRPLRYVAHDVADLLVAVVVSLWQRLQPQDHVLASA